LVAAEPGEAIGEGHDDRRHALFPDQPVEPFRQVLAEADPVRMGEAAAGETDKVHQQRQALSAMPGREVHIDDAHQRITQHVALEGLALDSDPADATYRPEEFTHAPLTPGSSDHISGHHYRIHQALRPSGRWLSEHLISRAHPRKAIPNFAKIVVIPMPEATTRLAALRAGHVDWIEVPPVDAIPSLEPILPDGHQPARYGQLESGILVAGASSNSEADTSRAPSALLRRHRQRVAGRAGQCHDRFRAQRAWGRRKGAEPWLLMVASPSGSTADVADRA
jgi:hypothetical protein